MSEMGHSRRRQPRPSIHALPLFLQKLTQIRRLGLRRFARIGLLSVLHTRGSALNHHPHVHMIVPGGGISLDGARWVCFALRNRSTSRRALALTRHARRSNPHS
jgi:hypothetical protein